MGKKDKLETHEPTYVFGYNGKIIRAPKPWQYKAKQPKDPKYPGSGLVRPGRENGYHVVTFFGRTKKGNWWTCRCKHCGGTFLLNEREIRTDHAECVYCIGS